MLWLQSTWTFSRKSYIPPLSCPFPSCSHAEINPSLIPTAVDSKLDSSFWCFYMTSWCIHQALQVYTLFPAASANHFSTKVFFFKSEMKWGFYMLGRGKSAFFWYSFVHSYSFWSHSLSTRTHLHISMPQFIFKNKKVQAGPGTFSKAVKRKHWEMLALEKIWGASS